MEQLEKQFITSYESYLSAEGEEICEEVLVMVGECDELMIEKAKAFCEYFRFHKLDGVNTDKLTQRCRNYLEEYHNFLKYKNIFRKSNNTRKELLDMRNMKISNLKF